MDVAIKLGGRWISYPVECPEEYSDRWGPMQQLWLEVLLANGGYEKESDTVEAISVDGKVLWDKTVDGNRWNIWTYLTCHEPDGSIKDEFLKYAT